MKQHKKEVQLAELERSPRKVSFNRLSPISSNCCDEKVLAWTTHIFWSKFPEGLSIGVPSHSRKNRDPGGGLRGSILVFRGVSQQSWLPKKTIYCQPSVHRFHSVGHQWVHLPDARRHSISAVSERPVTEQSWAFPEMSVSVTTAVSRSGRWGSWGATFVFVAPQPMATPKMMKKQKFCEPQNEPLGAKGEARKSIPNWLYDA